MAAANDCVGRRSIKKSTERVSSEASGKNVIMRFHHARVALPGRYFVTVAVTIFNLDSRVQWDKPFVSEFRLSRSARVCRNFASESDRVTWKLHA